MSNPGLEKLRTRIQAELARRREERASYKAPFPPPRYDDEFFKGLEWLDSLSYSDNWEETYKAMHDDEFVKFKETYSEVIPKMTKESFIEAYRKANSPEERKALVDSYIQEVAISGGCFSSITYKTSHDILKAKLEGSDPYQPQVWATIEEFFDRVAHNPTDFSFECSLNCMGEEENNENI